MIPLLCRSGNSLALALGFALVQIACGPAAAPVPQAAPGAPLLQPLAPVPQNVSGRILYINLTAIMAFNLPKTEPVQVTAFPEGTYPGGLAASPDGSRVAFSLYQPGASRSELGGTDLFTMKPNGSDRQPFLAHQVQGEALLNPAWSDDGKTLYYTRWSPQGGQQIERVTLDGASPAVVMTNGHSPTIAQGQLVYLSTDPKTRSTSMMVASVDGKNTRPLFDASAFGIVASPRFSPDGKRIAFVAVGGPSTPGTGGSGKAPSTNPSPGSGLASLGAGQALGYWFEPEVAAAHGVPWDLWMVNADGSGLTQLTNMAEDSPLPAWSADGKWIALGGELGMYLVQPDAKAVIRFSDQPGLGGIAWVR